MGFEHGKTSGIVPSKKTEEFFGKPNEIKSQNIKVITIQFFSENYNTNFKTNVMYYKSKTHQHMHLTGNLMPAYKKAGAEEGDVLLFWKSKRIENLYRVDLVKKGTDKFEIIKSKIGGAGGFIKDFYLEEDEEEYYQQESAVEEDIDERDFPTIPKKEMIKSSVVKRLSRNKSKGDYVLKKNNYKCEVNESHKTFVARSGNPYMEKHHLIPLNYYQGFDNYLDDVANIVSLCPLCHRFVHIGKKEDYNSLKSLTDRQQWDFKRRHELFTRSEQIRQILAKLHQEGHLEDFEARLKKNGI